MADPRLVEHAKFIVHKSTRVKKNDNLVIHIDDDGMDLAVEIYKAASELGAHPIIIAAPSEALRAQLAKAPKDTLTSTPQHMLSLISNCDVYIGVRSDSNIRALASVEPKSLAMYSKALVSYSVSERGLRPRSRNELVRIPRLRLRRHTSRR
jgi:aminopeptidase